MVSRREFIEALGAAGLLAAGRSARALEVIRERTQGVGAPAELTRDEDFWFEVGEAFTMDRSLVNLNNGGVSPSPAMVQDAMRRHLEFSNTAPPAYALWRILEPQREAVRDRLARHWACEPDEIALTRNASEGLQICQFGFDLVKGDEVLTTTQDYGRMLTTFKQRERRDGIKLVQVPIPVPARDPAQVVKLFEQAITPRTRLILMCHVINLTGQILPVRDVVRMARGRGIPVIVDGAHSFAHLPFRFPDLDCDYFATSLHKWLFAPHGTGLLYVRKDKIKGLWPLMAAAESQDSDIRKFEEIGTHPAANYLAIADALTFHQGLGDERKLRRLLYLRDSWARPLLEHDRVRLHTSLEPGHAGGIATFQVEGVPPGKIADWLWDRHRILVTPIVHAEFEGVRVSPSVYTRSEELDRFVSAMKHVIREGLPA